ncbi:hypothetical protein P5673_026508 [Acropora cervicornis]|uniref:Uncharacterized protein n=1 Tax=Acropora cervicornis TaxID=6130 RepID=A0AAD9UWE4_ACRCE|nr:hypothetical protein P5673_026508 [Acropora cervicornis]
MYNIKETAFEEFSDVTDPRVTFEIQVCIKVGVDSVGPRKQWLRLCNRNVKLKNFDNGLQEQLVEDFVFVGQMKVFYILYLLRPFQSRDTAKLSVRKRLLLLREQFSEEGSHSRSYETDVCARFVKHVGAVSSGRGVHGYL